MADCISSEALASLAGRWTLQRQRRWRSISLLGAESEAESLGAVAGRCQLLEMIPAPVLWGWVCQMPMRAGTEKKRAVFSEAAAAAGGGAARGGGSRPDLGRDVDPQSFQRTAIGLLEGAEDHWQQSIYICLGGGLACNLRGLLPSPPVCPFRMSSQFSPCGWTSIQAHSI